MQGYSRLSCTHQFPSTCEPFYCLFALKHLEQICFTPGDPMYLEFFLACWSPAFPTRVPIMWMLTIFQGATNSNPFKGIAKWNKKYRIQRKDEEPFRHMTCSQSVEVFLHINPATSTLSSFYFHRVLYILVLKHWAKHFITPSPSTFRIRTCLRLVIMKWLNHGKHLQEHLTYGGHKVSSCSWYF